MHQSSSIRIFRNNIFIHVSKSPARPCCCFFKAFLRVTYGWLNPWNLDIICWLFASMCWSWRGMIQSEEGRVFEEAHIFQEPTVVCTSRSHPCRISSMHAFCEWVCNIILESMWKRKKLKVMDSAECFSDLWKTRWHGNCRVEGPTPPHDQRTSRLHGRRSSCLHLSRCGYKWSSKIHFVLGRSRSCLKCLADAAWMFF